MLSELSRREFVASAAATGIVTAIPFEGSPAVEVASDPLTRLGELRDSQEEISDRDLLDVIKDVMESQDGAMKIDANSTPTNPQPETHRRGILRTSLGDHAFHLNYHLYVSDTLQSEGANLIIDLGKDEEVNIILNATKPPVTPYVDEGIYRMIIRAVGDGRIHYMAGNIVQAALLGQSHRSLDKRVVAGAILEAVTKGEGSTYYEDSLGPMLCYDEKLSVIEDMLQSGQLPTGDLFDIPNVMPSIPAQPRLTRQNIFQLIARQGAGIAKILEGMSSEPDEALEMLESRDASIPIADQTFNRQNFLRMLGQPGFSAAGIVREVFLQVPEQLPELTEGELVELPATAETLIEEFGHPQ